MKTDDIDISNCDKAEILAALYNASRQQGMGLMHSRGREPMTKEQAAEEITNAGVRSYFDYLHGRVMKIDLSGDVMRTFLYDRDNGEGSAAMAIAHLMNDKEA